MKNVNKLLFIVLCILVLKMQSGHAQTAESPANVTVGTAPTQLPPAPVIPQKPGEVYQIQADGKPLLVDMTRFQVYAVEWSSLPAYWPSGDVVLGLRADGVVVWCRVAKGERTCR